MKNLTKHFGKVAAAGSIFLASLSGCAAESTNCSIDSHDSSAFDVNSALDAAKICNAHKEMVLKCVKVPDGMSANAREVDVNCGDANADAELSDLYSNADAVVCKATAHPDQVIISCTTK